EPAPAHPWRRPTILLTRACGTGSSDDAAPLGAGYAHALAIRSASGSPGAGARRPQVSPRHSSLGDGDMASTYVTVAIPYVNADRVRCRGELVLPSLEVSGAPRRADQLRPPCRSSRAIPPGSPVLRSFGSGRHQRVPLSRARPRVGAHCARGPGPGDLRVVRR